MRCAKVRYRSELSAKIALFWCQTSNSDKRRERRVYPCPDCAGWHLTSQPRRSGR